MRQQAGPAAVDRGRKDVKNGLMKKMVSLKVLRTTGSGFGSMMGSRGWPDLLREAGRGVFCGLEPIAFLRKAFVADYGSLYLAGRLDFCPERVWLQITRKQPEDLFPNLKALAEHA